MADAKRVSEAAPRYAEVVTDLESPLVLERAGKPVAVIISIEDYRRLQALAEDEQQRRAAGWLALDALLTTVHQRPTEYTADQIEAEIGKARDEVGKHRRGSRRSH